MSDEVSWIGGVAPTIAFAGALSVLLITVALTAATPCAPGHHRWGPRDIGRVSLAITVVMGALAVRAWS